MKWDRKIEQEASFSELYSWQQQNNNAKKIFVLHDSPTFDNGKVHIGHVINKILKDIVVRSKILQGFRVHYIPVGDCHGLPVELKDDQYLPLLDIRRKSSNFATKTVQEQMKEFKSWGLVADWENAYFINSPQYISKQLQAFYSCFEKGLIYRQYKPVHWSPSSRTALAEAELEYFYHTSTAVYVEFPIANACEALSKYVAKQVTFLCWTTTPWTLPLNQAICYAPYKDYAVVESTCSERYWVIAVDTCKNLQDKLNASLRVLNVFRGNHLKGCTYGSPLAKGVTFPLLEGSRVATDKGTGLVHTAPNHGFEDFKVIQQHGIPIQKCLIDGEGKYTPDAGPELSGIDVLGNGTSTVLELVKENLVHTEKYQHCYPYDWRTKKPVIIRATKQWFMSIDKIRDQMLACLDDIKFYPPMLKEMLKSDIKNRPDWCISRQRSWGVPIPVFFAGEESKVVVNKEIIDHLCSLLNKKGNDFWWNSEIEELLPTSVLEKSNLPLNDSYKASHDILDLWFDSGISWNAVLPEPQVSDLYLEGVDKLRGWFQSSLAMSIALQGHPPYKYVYLHGFALDDKGRNMSKSLNNIIEPSNIVGGGKSNDHYGVSVLRWWVAYQGSGHKNVAVSECIFTETEKTLINVRLILRFLLGNIQDYDHHKHQCSLNQLRNLDRCMLHRLYEFYNDIRKSYRYMNFSEVIKLALYFMMNDLSAIYFSAIKDRLYCDKESSLHRRSCQTVLYHILHNLVRTVAPIIPHLAEETFLHYPLKNADGKGVFQQEWLQPDLSWYQPELYQSFTTAMSIREAINGLYLKTQMKDLDLILVANRAFIIHLKPLQEQESSSDSDLCYVLQAASVTLTSKHSEHLEISYIAATETVIQLDGNLEDCKLLLMSSPKSLCSRCRRRTVTDNQLCKRCQIVMKDLPILKVQFSS